MFQNKEKQAARHDASPANALAAVMMFMVLLSGCADRTEQDAAPPPAGSGAASPAPTEASPSPTEAAGDECAGLPLDEADLCYAEAEGGEGGDEFGVESGGETDLSAQRTADLGGGLTLTELKVRVGNEDGERSPNDPKHADETYFHIEMTVRNDSTQPIDLRDLDAFTGVTSVFYDVNEFPAQEWATASGNRLPNKISPGTTVTFAEDVSMPTPVPPPVIVVFDGTPLGLAEHRLVGVSDRFKI